MEILAEIDADGFHRLILCITIVPLLRADDGTVDHMVLFLQKQEGLGKALEVSGVRGIDSLLFIYHRRPEHQYGILFY